MSFTYKKDLGSLLYENTEVTEILIYMTNTMIVLAVVLVLGVLAVIYLALKHKGDLDLHVDFKKGQLSLKKKK